jgi:hypothetical protein
MEIQEDLGLIKDALPDLPQQHAVQYLNAMRTDDLEMALSGFRRYSDYFAENRDVLSLQSIALRLAWLYTSFGFESEARQAVLQAIPFARDRNDDECLSLLLSWLNQHENEGDATRPSRFDMLESLAKRTRLGNQHTLQLMCELSKIKLQMEMGEQQDAIYKGLQNANALVVQHQLLDVEPTMRLVHIAALEHFGKMQEAKLLLELLLPRLDSLKPQDGVLLLSKLASHVFQLIRKHM